MGLFGGGTNKIINAIGSTIDEVFTSDDERLSKAEIMAKLQTDISIAELQTRSIFLAGWRPFLGWVLASSIAFRIIIFPMVQWIAGGFFNYTIPQFDTSMDGIMTELIFGMLGLAGMRTYEKQKGLTK
ncbi:MAG: 3TM-type holin [Candidatus Omnitrophota bacterium]